MAEQELRGWTKKNIIPGVNCAADGIDRPLIAFYQNTTPGQFTEGIIPDIECIGGVVNPFGKYRVWPGALMVRALMEVGLRAVVGEGQNCKPFFKEIRKWALPEQMKPGIQYSLFATIIERDGDQIVMEGLVISENEAILPQGQIVFEIKE